VGTLQVRHAALVGRGGKARHVAHHATAQCHDDRLAVCLRFQQCVEHLIQRAPILVCLAVGQLDALACGAGGNQRRLELLRV
jgi:hypothetical protein